MSLGSVYKNDVADGVDTGSVITGQPVGMIPKASVDILTMIHACLRVIKAWMGTRPFVQSIVLVGERGPVHGSSWIVQGPSPAEDSFAPASIAKAGVGPAGPFQTVQARSL